MRVVKQIFYLAPTGRLICEIREICGKNILA
jgi:hypothetical protein